MKNLKRVLSLGLASVMLLGMMVVGASAKDFTDAADIVHTEAVDIMVALKIINGREDGSYFAPKENVTRGEMAKMIAVLMNGGSEANTGTKGTPSFTDIGGHWAEGWIEYCADMKIIGGRGDGTFDPNGLVTGVEALKMVLTAMGYDAVAYNLQGAGWAAQTIENARTTGGMKLVESLDDVVLTDPATRDTAAQMIWNGLQAYVVKVEPAKNTSTGETTWDYKVNGTTTLLNQRYNAYVATGTYAGTKKYGAPSALDGEIGVKFNKNNANDNIGLLDTTTYCFPSELGIDNIGEEVKVVWKNGTRSSTIGPDKNDTIYGAFNTGATRVLRTQMSKIQDYKDDDKAILKIDGAKYECAKQTTEKSDGTTVTSYNVAFVRNFHDEPAKSAQPTEKKQNDGTSYSPKQWNSSALTSALKKNSGNTIKVIFDEDGKVEKVFLVENYVGVVTAVNSENITINGGKACTLKIADHDIEEGLKRGDVVAITPYYTTDPTATDAYVSVKKAEKVSGELESWKGIVDDPATSKDESEDENVVVGGKTYKINYKNVGGAQHGLLKADIPDLERGYEQIKEINTTGDKLIGEDFDLYLINGYVVAMVQTSESANNYSVVLEVKGSSTTGSVFNALQLHVMGADGEKEVITVSKSSSEGRDVNDPKVIDYKDYQPGDIVTYTINEKDEAKVNLVGTASVQNFKYSSKDKAVNGKPVAADCVLYVQTKAGAKFVDAADATSGDLVKTIGADWEAYDIRALDDLNDNGSAYTDKRATVVVDDRTGKVMAAFLNFGGTPDGAADETVYGIVTTDTVRVKDYYRYTVMANGEEYTVNYEDPDFKKGDLVKFRPTTNDKYSTGKVNKIENDLEAKWHYEGTWIKEYNSRDNTLITYNKKPEQVGTDGAYFGDKDDISVYAIASDAKIVYVDQDGVKSAGESSINEFSAVTGKMNAAFLWKEGDSGVKIIQALFVETSGKKTANKNLKADTDRDN